MAVAAGGGAGAAVAAVELGTEASAEYVPCAAFCKHKEAEPPVDMVGGGPDVPAQRSCECNGWQVGASNVRAANACWRGERMRAWSGVQSVQSRAFTSAPRSTRAATVSRKPQPARMPRGREQATDQDAQHARER